MASLGAINKTDSPDNQGFLMTIKQYILNANTAPVTELLNETIETGIIKRENLGTQDTKVSFETAEQILSQIAIFICKILGISLDDINVGGKL